MVSSCDNVNYLPSPPLYRVSVIRSPPRRGKCAWVVSRKYLVLLAVSWLASLIPRCAPSPNYVTILPHRPPSSSSLSSGSLARYLVSSVSRFALQIHHLHIMHLLHALYAIDSLIVCRCQSTFDVVSSLSYPLRPFSSLAGSVMYDPLCASFYELWPLACTEILTLRCKPLQPD